MKHLYLVLFAIIVILQPGFLDAQAISNPTKQDYFDAQAFITENFISKMEGVPAGFQPNNIRDYSAYLPSGYDFKEVEDKYETIYYYVSSFLNSNSEEDFLEVHALSQNSNNDPGYGLPPCFATFSHSQQLNIIATVSCCAGTGGWGCVGCIAVGAAAEQVLFNQFEDCISRY